MPDSIIRQQDKDYSRLAGTQESQGHSILLRFRKLLPLVHLQLLRHCYSIDTPHPEGHSLEVQLLLSRCFQLSQESIYLRTYPHSLDSQCSTCYGSRLKGLSQETTLVLSNTRELDRVPNTK